MEGDEIGLVQQGLKLDRLGPALSELGRCQVRVACNDTHAKQRAGELRHPSADVAEPDDPDRLAQDVVPN